MYLIIIKFLSSKILFYFLLYNLTIFYGTALLKQEYKTIIYFCLIFYIFSIIFLIFYTKFFFLLITLLKTFNESYFYFEIRISTIFYLFISYYNVYYYYSVIIFIIIYLIINLKKNIIILNKRLYFLIFLFNLILCLKIYCIFEFFLFINSIFKILKKIK